MLGFKQFVTESQGHLCAAIRHKNRIHQANSGEGHGQLSRRIVRDGHATYRDLDKADWGFTTHTGEFLHRDEAVPYALENNLFRNERTHKDYSDGYARAPGKFGLATQHLRGFGSEEEYGEY